MTIAYHVQPFFVLLLARIFHGDRARRSALAWVGMAFAGLILAIGADPGVVVDLRATLIGAALAILAALLYAGAVIAAKGIARTPPAVTTIVQTLLGALVLGLLAPPDLGQLTSPAWPWLLGLGALHTGLVYVLMYGAYPRLTGARIAVLAFLNPLAAIASDALVYGTPVTLLQVIGMAMIATATLAVKRG